MDSQMQLEAKSRTRLSKKLSKHFNTSDIEWNPRTNKGSANDVDFQSSLWAAVIEWNLVTVGIPVVPIITFAIVAAEREGGVITLL